MILLQNHQNVQWTLSMLTKMTTLSTYWLYSSWWNQHWEVMIAKICLPHRCRTVPKLLCCYCFKQIQMPANNCRPLEKFHIFYEKFAILRMKYILCIFKIRWKYIGKHVFMYLKVIYSKYSWHVFEDISQSIKPGKWNLDWLSQVHSNLFLQRQQISKFKLFLYKKYLSANFISQKVSVRNICENKLIYQKFQKNSRKFFLQKHFQSLLHWVYPFSHQCTQIPGESSQIISSILQNF